MEKFKLNASGGKGDSYRPIDKKAYDATWERAFGKMGGDNCGKKRAGKKKSRP